MFVSVEGEAQDAVSKLKEDAIRSKAGLKIILAQLGKKFQALEILETYKGINYISIIDTVISLGKVFTKLRPTAFKCQMI